MQQYVIIVAGGIGSRMKADRPKQFIELAGVPVIIRTMRLFLDFDPEIRTIISVHKNYVPHLDALLDKFQLRSDKVQVTVGGETRFESVKNGLLLIHDASAIVGIHDAARPLVSVATIAACYEGAKTKGNAVPCVTISESMRKISNNVNNPVNRNEYRIIQTPQCFLASPIKAAYENAYHSGFTDDATVLESTGEIINLVEGNEENIKITSPRDLLFANALLSQ